jgi:hypothetical protein
MTPHQCFVLEIQLLTQASANSSHDSARTLFVSKWAQVRYESSLDTYLL